MVAVAPGRQGSLGEAPRHNCMGSAVQTTLIGVRFHPLTPALLEDYVGRLLDCGGSHVIHFLASDPTVRASGDGQYRALLNQADINVPDGLPIVWALTLDGYKSYRVAGTDGVNLLSRWGRKRGLSHYYFGGTEEVSHLLPRVLRTKAPGIGSPAPNRPPSAPSTSPTSSRRRRGFARPGPICCG
jgi:UDP-N-acetyl-D-mannosaminuronic acid transferase (WecB/TagA/CpsF family)